MVKTDVTGSLSSPGQVDVAHDRALLDVGQGPALGTAHVANHLFDEQFTLGSVTREVHDPDVFEPHQGCDDLTRVCDDEGALRLLAHTTSLKHLRRSFNRRSGP